MCSQNVHQTIQRCSRKIEAMKAPELSMLTLDYPWAVATARAGSQAAMAMALASGTTTAVALATPWPTAVARASCP